MELLAPEAARAVVPRRAATVLILQDAEHGPEVLMVRRSESAKFMPGAYVFPGGGVDALDAQTQSDESLQELAPRVGVKLGISAEEARAFAAAASRECFEECGLWLGAGEIAPATLASLRNQLHGGASIQTVAEAGGLRVATSALIPWSRWLTPFGRTRRFDTAFFLCRAPQGQEPTADEKETTTLQWVRPQQALDTYSRGEFQMEFATLNTVRSLVATSTGTVASLLDAAGAISTIPRTEPRLILGRQGEVVRVALPSDPAYSSGYAG